MKKIILLTPTSGNNLDLAKMFDQALSSLGANCELINLEELSLPLYGPKQEQSGIPEQVLKLTESVKAADGLVVCGPEYNGGIAPVLTNAVSWISRSGDEDWRAAFKNKPALVNTFSGGGGMKALIAMKSQLDHVGCVVLPRSIVANLKAPPKEASVNAGSKLLLDFIR